MNDVTTTQPAQSHGHQSTASAHAHTHNHGHAHAHDDACACGHDHQHHAGPMTPVRSTKVGRNEPCPCGSGKKYKKCCLA